MGNKVDKQLLHFSMQIQNKYNRFLKQQQQQHSFHGQYMRTTWLSQYQNLEPSRA